MMVKRLGNNTRNHGVELDCGAVVTDAAQTVRGGTLQAMCVVFIAESW